MQSSDSSEPANARPRPAPEARLLLGDSEYLAQQYLDIAGVILVVLDVDGDITLLNHKGHEVLGYPEGSLIGENWFETCVPQRRRSEVVSVFRRLMAGEIQSVEHVENLVVTRSGEERLVAWHNALLKNKAGQCVGTLSSGEDVTDRRRAEELLRHKTAELEQFFKCPLDLLCIADTDGYFRRLNRGWETVLGYRLEELEGRRFLDFVHPDDIDATLGAIAQLAEQRPLLSFTNRYRRKDGSYRWIEWRSYSMGKAIYASARDMTERRQMEEDLREAHRQAEAASQAKSQFLAHMSHEIRTPMTAILGFTDVLMDSNLSHEERRGYLETIRRNGKALLELLNDILDLSKIEAEKMLVEPADCCLRQLVDDVLGTVRVRAADKGLSLDVDFVEPLPKTIHTDSTRLRQILLNLAGNAVKFTERGGVRITICSEGPLLSAGNRPGLAAARMRFAVADTGIGIPAEKLGELFQPFTQADVSTTRRFGGTGLGLAISKRLANLLGGDIAVTSEPGRGSTFTLTIDVGLAGDRPAPSDEPDASAAGQTSKTARTILGRVLLAEDAPDVRALLSQVLRGMSLDVQTAEDGCVACQMAAQSQEEGRPFDLILMDIQMPKMDGLEATRRLRDCNWRGPIVALTAYATTSDREKCLAAGCDEHVAKTVELGELRATIARHLRRDDVLIGRPAMP